MNAVRKRKKKKMMMKMKKRIGIDIGMTHIVKGIVVMLIIIIRIEIIIGIIDGRRAITAVIAVVAS